MRRISTAFALAAGVAIVAVVAVVASAKSAFAGEAETSFAIAELIERPKQQALRAIYERVAFKPLWSGDKARGKAAAELFARIAAADSEGLDPRDYKVDGLGKRALATLDDGATAEELAMLDFALTSAFLALAEDQLFGRFDANTLGERTLRARERKYLANILVGAAAKKDPLAAIRVIYPFASDYPHLLAGLAEYRAMADQGGWEKVPSRILRVRPGASDPSVAILRERLIPDTDGGEVFDDELQAALEVFQAQHGLEPDGHAGEATLRELNVTAAERARQIELNLERRRWIGQPLGEKYLLVNIPEFTVHAVRGTETELSCKVVVGKKAHETPIVTTHVIALQINPDWHVPENITNQEVIPEAQKDPAWLTDRGIRVLQGKGREQIELDPTEVDWDRDDVKELHFQQPAGPGNALGQLKLVTPNRFEVYLHDTPQRSLFKRPVRAFSHGCVRLEEPIKIAEWVLADDEWQQTAIIDEMNSRKSKTVKVKEPPGAYLVYWTAWVGEDGAMHFAPDIYGWDKKLDRALAHRENRHDGEESRVVSTAQGALRTTRSATLPSSK